MVLRCIQTIKMKRRLRDLESFDIGLDPSVYRADDAETENANDTDVDSVNDRDDCVRRLLTGGRR